MAQCRSARKTLNHSFKCKQTPFYVVLVTFDHHIYSLCHRYWTCAASEARYVFSGYRILTDGVINRTRFVVFCDHFPVVLRWDGVIIGLTNILNRKRCIHNHANFKRNNRINWSIKQLTCMSVLYVFLLFSQIYKGRPAFVRGCAIHISVRFTPVSGINRVYTFSVCVKIYPLSITCSWRPLIDLNEGNSIFRSIQWTHSRTEIPKIVN